MAVTESDLRTFASTLRRERQPDLDVIVNDYRWPVHSHIISGHGIFRELCSDAPENDKRREVHLHDDEPFIVAHLIIWWYTQEYDDGTMPVEMAGLGVQSLLKHGKVSPSARSDQDISEPEAEPDRVQEDADCADLPPISLHAKMYLIAQKYGITELSEKAVYEITEILGLEKEALLPCLAHFFAAKSPVDGSTNGKDGKIPTDDKVSATTTTTSSSSSPARYTISEQKDPKLWKVLAETTSQHVLTYHADPVFHWAVMHRVASMLEAARDKLASIPAEPAKVPKKRGRKKQENTQGSKFVDDKKKAQEDAAHTPKKVKKES